MNIWKDCEKRPLPEVLSFIVDNRGKTVPVSEDGNYTLIATNCIRNENLYPSYEKKDYFQKILIKTGFGHIRYQEILFLYVKGLREEYVWCLIL